MLIYKTKQELYTHLQHQQGNNLSIGFVPTMGALHQGHLSLISESKIKCDLTVCSIFINPTQFNNIQDFEKYPITTQEDIEQLHTVGNDILFLPSVQDIYSEGLTNLERYDLGKLETIYEGHYRPGHFQGVCQIVHRLLDIVNPNILFLGQKDYQQCMVIEKLISILQKNITIDIVPTVREKTGLAMSSRNRLLSPSAKQQASSIYQAMVNLSADIHTHSIAIAEKKAQVYLLEKGFSKIDYVSIADAKTLDSIDLPKTKQNLVILVAAFIQNIRLIDNLLIQF